MSLSDFPYNVHQINTVALVLLRPNTLYLERGLGTLDCAGNGTECSSRVGQTDLEDIQKVPGVARENSSDYGDERFLHFEIIVLGEF